MQYLTVSIMLTERERDRDRDTERDTHRERETQRHRERETDTQRERSLITVFSQVFWKYLTERKLERTRTKKTNAFCLPSIGFSTQSSQYHI